MRNFESIQTTPTEESCAQLGNLNYETESKIEIQVFIEQLKRVFGEPPAGVTIRKQSNPHDFGSYYDIKISYDEDNEVQENFVFHLVDNLPEYWDEEAKNQIQELRQKYYNADNPILKVA